MPPKVTVKAKDGKVRPQVVSYDTAVIDLCILSLSLLQKTNSKSVTTTAKSTGGAKGASKPAGSKSSVGKAAKGGALQAKAVVSVPAPPPVPEPPEPPPPSKAGKAVVCYNHYKSEFKIDDFGAMKWKDIDEVCTRVSRA